MVFQNSPTYLKKRSRKLATSVGNPSLDLNVSRPKVSRGAKVEATRVPNDTFWKPKNWQHPLHRLPLIVKLVTSERHLDTNEPAHMSAEIFGKWHHEPRQINRRHGRNLKIITFSAQAKHFPSMQAHLCHGRTLLTSRFLEACEALHSGMSDLKMSKDLFDFKNFQEMILD